MPIQPTPIPASAMRRQRPRASRAIRSRELSEAEDARGWTRDEGRRYSRLLNSVWRHDVTWSPIEPGLPVVPRRRSQQLFGDDLEPVSDAVVSLWRLLGLRPAAGVTGAGGGGGDFAVRSGGVARRARPMAARRLTPTRSRRRRRT